MSDAVYQEKKKTCCKDTIVLIDDVKKEKGTHSLVYFCGKQQRTDAGSSAVCLSLVGVNNPEAWLS